MPTASTQAWSESSTYRSMVSSLLVGGGAVVVRSRLWLRGWHISQLRKDTHIVVSRHKFYQGHDFDYHNISSRMRGLLNNNTGRVLR